VAGLGVDVVFCSQLEEEKVIAIIEQNSRYESREMGEPICGKHFCDECGDCLYCHGDEPCYIGGVHRWVIYKEGVE
jgi:hypothetical protein